MAHETRDLFHSHSVDLPILVAPEAGLFIRPEGVYGPLVTVFTDKLLNGDMPCVPGGLRDVRSPLGCLIPVACYAGFPRCCFAVWLGGFAFRREHELDQKTVLLDDPELMTVLADDVPMTR